MKGIATTVVVLGVVALCASGFAQAVLAAEAPAKAGPAVKAETAPAIPADRVVVMYFHRTQRCPTCLKMGSYSEEAVKEGFAAQVKERKVEFHYIDFQNKKNEALTKGYKVTGPTLIVARVVDNKVASRKNLTEIWTKVRE